MNREALIQRYADGPDLLRTALAQVPAEAMKWRPAPGKWSVHEIIVHCADSETNAHMRIRFILGEKEPRIMAYDQDQWARVLRYHDLPLGPALATIDAVRANTVPLLRAMSDADWKKAGIHPEHPSYGAEKWLEVYADHLEVHSRQIARNVEGWKGARR